MKDFLLDSTYKDITIINSNDDIAITSYSSLPSNFLSHHLINYNKSNYAYSSTHNRNNKFNIYKTIDYL